MKVWRAPTGFLEHFIPFQIEEFFVPLRPPRESVNPIKAEDVIDPENMKRPRDCASPFSPPIKIPAAHFGPVVNRNTPVLSPFLSKLVVLEVRFGRRATAPIERELLALRKHIRAVVADAKWNVAHQS